GDARFGEQTHVAAQRDELGAHLADRRPIVLAEIGNRFVIRDQSAEKPDHLEIATGLTLQPPARLHPIEIAVDVELEQGRGMIRGPARYFRHNAFEPELAQIKRIDERIDRANRIVLINQFIQAFGQQSRLPTIRPNQEALHRFSPQIARRIITSKTFSRSQGHSLQVRPRPLVHKCPLCINTDRKFWGLGFVAMGQSRPNAPQQKHRHLCANDKLSVLPTDLMSALHRAISDRSSFPSSSGEEPPATYPVSASLSLIAGSASTVLVSALILRTISGGVL